jgi:heat shock protein HslJ
MTEPRCWLDSVAALRVLHQMAVLGKARIDFPVACKVDSTDGLGTNFIAWGPCSRAMEDTTMRSTKATTMSSLSFIVVAIALGNLVMVAQTNSLAGRANGLPLIGTRWRLIDLEGKPVRGSGFESYFALKASEQRISGSTGQLVDASPDGRNRLTGSYEANGSSLRFDIVAKTLLVCYPRRIPVDQEHAPTSVPSGDYTIKDSNQGDLFVLALKETSGFTIHGVTLELLSQRGRILARLEAASADHQ